MRGENCVEPAAAWIKAATGRDIWAELGGPPADWREAAALYRRLGVRCLAEAVTVLLGPPIPTRQARRGDLVMMRGALGVCHGEIATFIDAAWPMRKVELAWSLGCAGAALPRYARPRAGSRGRPLPSGRQPEDRPLPSVGISASACPPDRQPEDRR